MDRMPPGSGACCLPQSEGVTYLKIGTLGAIVGMMNLEAIFRQLYSLGRRPEEATDAELVGMARRSNYIPNRPAIETDYAAALRRAYAAFFLRQEAERGRAAR